MTVNIQFMFILFHFPISYIFFIVASDKQWKLASAESFTEHVSVKIFWLHLYRKPRGPGLPGIAVDSVEAQQQQQ